MKIYTTSKGYKLGVQIILSILLLLAVRFHIKEAHVQFVSTAIVFTLMMLVVIFNIKRKVTIGKKNITSENIFSKHVLQFDQIKGYRDNYTYIALIPNTGNGKSIVLPITLGKYDRLERWTRAKFQDLVRQEEWALVNNPELGNSISERKARLMWIQIQAILFNVLVFLLLLVAFLDPIRNKVLYLLFLMPWIAGILGYYHKGRIKIQALKTYPSILYALLFSTIGLLFHGTFRLNFFSHSNTWLPAIIIAVTLSGWLVITTKPYEGDRTFGFTSATLFAALMIAYGFGTTIFFNNVSDKSAPTYYKTVVLDKKIYHGRRKGTSYCLRIAPWGPQSETKEVSIGRSFYKKINIHDSVMICYRKGMFDIPFYKVEEK